MKKNLFIILFGFTFASFFYYEADPFFLFEHEMNQFNSEDFSVNLNNRPTFNKNIEKDYNLFYNSWYYYNDNAPNLENTSNRWVSRGSSFYNSIHLDYFPRFDLPFLSNNQLLLSLEPFFFTSENLFLAKALLQSIKPSINKIIFCISSSISQFLNKQI